MSDNPFSEPTTDSGFEPTKTMPDVQPSNNLLMVILIICLVLGVMGFLGSLMGIAGLVMQSTFSGMQGQTDEFTKQLQELQNEQFVSNLIQIVMNMIVAPLLAIAAIGGLARKKWAYGLLKTSLFVAAIYVAIRAVITAVSQISLMGKMSEIMESSMAQQGGENAQQGAEIAGNFMQMGIMVAVIMGGLWAFGLFAFYLGSWFYVKKDSVKNHFRLNQ